MNLLEKLNNGDVSFLFNNDFDDMKLIHIFESFKKNTNDNKVLKDIYIYIIINDVKLAFLFIYDLPAFSDEVITILNRHPELIHNNYIFHSFLYNHDLAENYIYKNYNDIKFEGTVYDYEIGDMYTELLTYIFNSSKIKDEWLNKLLKQPDMRRRYKLINYIIENKSEELNTINYFDTFDNSNQPSLDTDLMNVSFVSTLAVTVLKNGDYINYLKIKKYILSNYPSNDLAENIIKEIENISYENSSSEVAKNLMMEFKNDSSVLFQTSRCFKYEMFKKYRLWLSKEDVKNFNYYYKLLGNNKMVDRINELGLLDEVIFNIDKYLKLSKVKKVKHLPFGSTCSCYQIGDYVIKLFTHKWGFGKVVCPDVFWAIKNIESNYYFNEYSNKIEGGFEIQRFLNKEINEEDIEKLKASILNDGYEIPIDFCVSNLGVLNSYMDADCFDPNLLPDWFKQNPLVVIDRDLFELRKTSKKKTLRRIIK